MCFGTFWKIGSFSVASWSIHRIRSMIRALIRALCPFFLFISVVERRTELRCLIELFLLLCTGKMSSTDGNGASPALACVFVHYFLFALHVATYEPSENHSLRVGISSSRDRGISVRF